MPTRPTTTGPSTETLAPLGDDPAYARSEEEQKTDANGQADNPPVDEHAMPELDSARMKVNSAVDALTAQFVKDGTVSRVGVAQLRDAIDALRQAIPRQTSKRRA